MNHRTEQHKQPRRAIWTICIAGLFFCPVARAQQGVTEQHLKFFESKIRPALVKYCYQCHSVEEGDSRAGLLVDTRDALLQGGDSGAAIAPGKPEESLLWEAINWEGYEMPPSQKMPAKVIADFKTWIEMGAPDPRERKLQNVTSKITQADIERGRRHWAFQSPKIDGEDSQLQQEAAARRNRRLPAGSTQIDSIVSSKLKHEGLTPSSPADAMTLLRRLNFDLIGLPPTPGEITAFVSDWDRDAPSAVTSKVDELLSSLQYGERWGRHWMDVARYAESSGMYNTTFPHAWRYRDYVIDSFNDDTPYDQFITEQIAGDLLPAATDEQWQENLIATGFLAVGMKRLNERNPRQFTADMVDEQIDTLTQGVLGITVSCARCHDHKFDPIPAKDYYALAGIFQSSTTFYGTKSGGQNHRPGDLLLLPILDQVATGKQSVAKIEAQMQSLRKERASMRSKIEPGGEKDAKAFARLRRREASLAGELSNLNADGTQKTFGMGVQEAAEYINASILVAGDVDQPAQKVPRGFLQVLDSVHFEVTDESSGREALAKALVSKDNPLTARVMVNRIWMHLLGRPLVGTPNNFGIAGMEPENQELLDYLAVRFMQEDWSIKALIREITLSETYQRSSTYHKQNYSVDPDNRFLWRANPRQLDAESLRDATLMLAGQLELEPPSGSEVTQLGDTKFGRTQSIEKFDQDNPHRSVYLPIIRDELQESLQLFDFPDPNVSSAGRSGSIIPTQALYLMNSEFVVKQANSMATNLMKQFSTTNEQVRHAFLLAYGRPVTAEEFRASVQFFKDFRPSQTSGNTAPAITPRRRRGGPASDSPQASRRNRRQSSPTSTPSSGAPNSQQQTLAVFCQTLMASAEFRILD